MESIREDGLERMLRGRAWDDVQLVHIEIATKFKDIPTYFKGSE